MTDNLAQFIDQMMQQAGLDKLPEDFQKEYREKLTASAQKRIGIIALKELDAKEVAEFEKLSQNEKNLNPEKLLEFFQSRIPDFEEKMSQALKDFASEFTQSAKKLSSQV